MTKLNEMMSKLKSGRDLHPFCEQTPTTDSNRYFSLRESDLPLVDTGRPKSVFTYSTTDSNLLETFALYLKHADVA